MTQQPDRPQYLPRWASVDAQGAVDDVVAYADTLTISELVGSLMCLTQNTTHNALRIGLTGRAESQRLRQRIAMSDVVTRILFDRLTDLHPGTHAHCTGFFDAVAIAETRVLSSRLGGLP